jgi:hypothetical protein
MDPDFERMVVQAQAQVAGLQNCGDVGIPDKQVFLFTAEGRSF